MPPHRGLPPLCVTGLADTAVSAPGGRCVYGLVVSENPVALGHHNASYRISPSQLTACARGTAVRPAIPADVPRQAPHQAPVFMSRPHLRNLITARTMPVSRSTM